MKLHNNMICIILIKYDISYKYYILMVFFWHTLIYHIKYTNFGLFSRDWVAVMFSIQ